jgi:hypothetical protein
MSFTRVKPAGWAFGELLTSAQMNQLDADHSVSASSTNVPAENSRSGVQIPLSAFVPDQETLANVDAWQYRARFLIEHDKSANNKAVCDLGPWLPHGVTVTQVQALAHGNIIGTGAHGSIASMTMPVVRFREMSTTGVTNYTASQADTSGDVPTYESDHPITVTVSRVISYLLRYMIIIEGEQSTNSLNDRFGLKSLSVSWTAP